MNNLFSIAERCFLVTGGTRGIGRSISLQFARAGATVFANYVRNLESAESLRFIAQRENLDIRLIRADLTSQKGLEKIELTLNTKGILSGIVSCAATGIHKPLSELTTRHLDWVFALNVKAFFELIQRLKKRLKEGASIVVVSSEGALRAVPSYIFVGASKGVPLIQWRGTWQWNWPLRGLGLIYWLRVPS